MSMHITRFIDRIKAFESRNQREFVMSMADARDLHADITKLLLQLQESHEVASEDPEVIEVQITGGAF